MFVAELSIQVGVDERARDVSCWPACQNRMNVSDARWRLRHGGCIASASNFPVARAREISQCALGGFRPEVVLAPGTRQDPVGHFLWHADVSNGFVLLQCRPRSIYQIIAVIWEDSFRCVFCLCFWWPPLDFCIRQTSSSSCPSKQLGQTCCHICMAPCGR